jgi:hypothetical protein
MMFLAMEELRENSFLFRKLVTKLSEKRMQRNVSSKRQVLENWYTQKKKLFLFKRQTRKITDFSMWKIRYGGVQKT